MTKKYLQLNALNVYKTAFNLSNFVWDVVIKWNFQHLTGYEVPVRSSCNGSLKECFDRNQKSNCENPQGLTELKPLQNLEGLTVRSMIIFSENFKNFQKDSTNSYSSQIKN